jgi:uncharacterized repeat protein (TIGR04042 family)
MPSVNFSLRWPNGELQHYYSPSTIIYQYLKPGAYYSAGEFGQLIESALLHASQRVQQQYGFACSAALDNLAMIQQQLQRLGLQASDRIEVVAMQHEQQGNKDE